MKDKKWEGVDYKSKDFHYARTSQEAFGKRLSSKDFENESKWADVGDIAVVVVCLVIAVYLMFFGWGI